MKQFYVFLIAMSLTLAVSAQKKGFHIGLKAGVNGNKLEGKSFDQEFSYNYLLGGFFQIPLGKRFGIQPEILFSQAKTTTSSNLSSPFNANDPNNKDVSLNYLDIPIMLNMGGNFKIQVGPQYSILMNSHNTLLQNGQDAFKNGNFYLGGGFQWKTPLLGLHLGGRYLIGLNDINSVSSQDNWKSQSLQVSAGFIF
ncbi:MAG: PorT family protein [Chitinophagaceae bacterium]|nr:PorT family protein [Chitinophagaceae bacterium]